MHTQNPHPLTKMNYNSEVIRFRKVIPMQLYNQLLSSVQNRPEYLSGVSPPPENWHRYSNYAQSLDPIRAEALYAVIIHYHFLQYNTIEPYPYKIRKLSAMGGVVLECSNLPSNLQHIIIAFLTTY
jgi:hypothetical protein